MQVNEFECNACDYKVYSFDLNVHGHGCPNCKINYGFSHNGTQNFHSRYNTISDIDDVLDKINIVEKKQDESQLYVEKKIDKILKFIKKINERQNELLEHSETVMKKQKKIIRKQNKLDDKVTDQYLADNEIKDMEDTDLDSPRTRRNSIVETDWSYGSPRSTDTDEILTRRQHTPPVRRSTVRKDLVQRSDYVTEKNITTQSLSCDNLNVTSHLKTFDDKKSSSIS